MLKRTLLLFSLFFIACTPVSSSEYKVTKVIDGDTIRLSNGRLLRYIGIDTPEVRIKENGKFNYQPQPFSLEAKEYNRKLVEGKTIKIEFDIVKEDRYRRLLGYCFVNGKLVNADLIEKGLAVLYTYPPNVRYVKDFTKAQDQARKNKRGLWGFYEAISSSEAENFINQIRTVRGRVLSTYNSGKVICLNFGQNYKKDFTVAIFKNSFKYFHDKGIQPESFYKGKVIEVTGKIREYNGPEIIVNTPYEIKIVE